MSHKSVIKIVCANSAIDEAKKQYLLVDSFKCEKCTNFYTCKAMGIYRPCKFAEDIAMRGINSMPSMAGWTTSLRDVSGMDKVLHIYEPTNLNALRRAIEQAKQYYTKPRGR